MEFKAMRLDYTAKGRNVDKEQDEGLSSGPINIQRWGEKRRNQQKRLLEKLSKELEVMTLVK